MFWIELALELFDSYNEGTTQFGSDELQPQTSILHDFLEEELIEFLIKPMIFLHYESFSIGYAH